MGLDMYLHAKKFIPKVDWEKTSKRTDKGYTTFPQFNKVIASAKMADVATNDIHGVGVEVVTAYWRKANQIHSWFVKNVQGGVDNCEDFRVSIEQLRELLGTCQMALSTKDPSLLAPQEGFFFGGTDIDEYYWGDIKDTIEQIKHILDVPDIESYEFSYRSSW